MIRPIETYYNGYRFRSRLEARWAVFFDACNVKYEYESEGFTYDGLFYLPDFRIRNASIGRYFGENKADLYVEIKPNSQISRDECEKIMKFPYPIIVFTEIPNDPDDIESTSLFYDRSEDMELSSFNYEYIDGDWFTAHPAANGKGKFGLEGDDSSYLEYAYSDVIKNAYLAARQARFEHGE